MPLETLSHSKMEQYRSCPLSFYFDDIIKAEQEPQFRDYAQVGKVVHNTIKDVLNFLVLNREDGILQPSFSTPLEVNISKFYAIHAQNYPLSDKEHETVALCLNNFYNFMMARLMYCDRLGIMEQYKPIQVESWATKTFEDCTFRGILDVLFYDEKYWAFDWKTSSSTAITDVEIRQATRYVILLGPIDHGTYLKEFYIINLRKPVSLVKSKIIITQSMIDEQIAEIKQVWELAKGDDFIKTPSYSSCLFCNHKLRCQAYGDFGKRR